MSQSQSQNEIGLALKSFILFDIIFVVSFCIGGLIEYRDNIFIIIFIIAILSTYYPLYFYVNEYFSQKSFREKSWYFKHLNTCIFFFIFRTILLFSFIIIAIIDLSAIDVPHTLFHLPLFSKIIIAFMFSALLMLMLLAIRILNFHHAYVFSNLNHIQIQASIIHASNPNFTQTATYRDLLQLPLDTSNDVLLIPSPTALDLTEFVTTNLN